MEGEAVKEGFKPPERKVRNVIHFFKGQKAEAACDDPHRNGEERNEIHKALSPEEKAGIGGFPNAAPPQVQGAVKKGAHLSCPRLPAKRK